MHPQYPLATMCGAAIHSWLHCATRSRHWKPPAPSTWPPKYTVNWKKLMAIALSAGYSAYCWAWALPRMPQNVP